MIGIFGMQVILGGLSGDNFTTGAAGARDRENRRLQLFYFCGIMARPEGFEPPTY